VLIEQLVSEHHALPGKIESSHEDIITIDTPDFRLFGKKNSLSYTVFMSFKYKQQEMVAEFGQILSSHFK